MEPRQPGQSNAPPAAKHAEPPPSLTELAAPKPPRLVEKTYHGRHGCQGNAEVWIEEFRATAERPQEATTLRPLPLHLDVRGHSPTGFAWGYSGSEPAQLALALLMDATGDEELAFRHYQDFKREAVALWPDEWSISAADIRAFVAGQRRRPQRTIRPWFEVDKQGLARILERKGKAFAVFE